MKVEKLIQVKHFDLCLVPSKHLKHVSYYFHGSFFKDFESSKDFKQVTDIRFNFQMNNNGGEWRMDEGC